MIDNPSISVVIPVLNEEESLRKLYNEISVSLNEYSNWDIIFVDDGSDDNSGKIIQKIAEEDSRISLIRFLENFGKADALSEGFKLAQGDIVITMDADLQDDPKEIIPLINKIQEGWDLVSGWKKDRKDPISKKVPSKLFNLVTRLFTGIKIHDFNCGLKAYRQRVVKSIELYGGLHRYIPALAGKKHCK
jgi:glycosyltransferase involved in cell wall biosynthesis